MIDLLIFSLSLSANEGILLSVVCPLGRETILAKIQLNYSSDA
jgi:hypothetical protein